MKREWDEIKSGWTPCEECGYVGQTSHDDNGNHWKVRDCPQGDDAKREPRSGPERGETVGKKVKSSERSLPADRRIAQSEDAASYSERRLEDFWQDLLWWRILVQHPEVELSATYLFLSREGLSKFCEGGHTCVSGAVICSRRDVLSRTTSRHKNHRCGILHIDSGVSWQMPRLPPSSSTSR